MRTIARFLLVLAPLMALVGCNSGLALLGSSSGSGGSTTVATTVSNVTVSDTTNSPARIGFTLAGQSVDAVHIEYLPPSAGGYVPIATLGSGDVNISSNGAANQFDWDFASDLGTEFVDGLAVRVRLGNGASLTTSEAISVGNSPPVISPFSFPEAEIVGFVGMLFTVADTSDTVSLEVEVNVDAESGFPEGAWEPALPGLGQALVPFVAAESGTTVPFFWNVVGQYGPLDSEVKVRATAVDTADPGADPLEHQVEGDSLLRVDNNAPPTVLLENLSFTPSADQRRGIVAPYTVIDAEGDTLDLVFQWSLEGEPFVDLPDDDALIEEILGDPTLRAQYRIATPLSMPGGTARSTGEADTVELPELGSSRSHLLQLAQQPGGDLSRALDGYGLEFMRVARIPEPLASTWDTNPLDGPVAVIPTSDLTTAYVLDRAGAKWRISEIDLATGTVVQVLATGAGTPDTMTLERGGAGLIVAAHDFDVLVFRVDLDTREVRAIVDGNMEPLAGEAVRGLASIGSEVALATLGDALVRVNYGDPLEATIATVLEGLATPWGVTVDPTRSNRIYLVERDFAGGGRVLSVALDTLIVEPLLVDASALPQPEDVAVEKGRLLVLTDETPGDGVKELRAVELGTLQTRVITNESPESARGLVTGDDGLRLLALPGEHDLVVGGGVVQRRAIVDYDPGRRVATVDTAFAAPITSEHWRLQPVSRLAVDAGVPRDGVFVWDSRDLPGGQGRALLRLTARDADAATVEHEGGKEILSGLAGAPLILGDSELTDGCGDVAMADLDGDGDLDLASANFSTSTLTIFFQTSAGVFDPVPLSLGSPETTGGTSAVAAADLDGDGDTDLVSTNFTADTLTIFFQDSPGAFDPVPSLTLGSTMTTDGVLRLAAADLDGDGDIDLVAGNGFDDGRDPIVVFFQTAPGVFDTEPSLILGDSETVRGNASVTAADLDGDGDIDIASANSGSNSNTEDATLTVFFQTAPGVYDTVPSLTLDVPDTNATPISVLAADLDGDGDTDLASADFGSNTISVFFQTEPGVFDTDPSLRLTDSTAGIPGDVVAADVDADGDVDIIAPTFASDALLVYFQTTPGVFDPAPLVLSDPVATNGPGSVLAADVDGDGDVDLVSANQFSDNIAVRFQTGAGVFSPEPAQTLGGAFSTGYPAGVQAADMDGDGDTDIVTANSGVFPIVENSVTVYFQSSPGIFDPEPLALGSSQTIEGAAAVAAADLDGDGDVDIVTANGADLENFISADGVDTLTVFFQRSPGVFDTEPALTLGGAPTTLGALDVVAADLDGDGDVDIVSANQISSTLTVFFQSGPGLFHSAPDLTLGGKTRTEGAVSLAVADLDGDEDLDLVSVNAISQTLTVFFQTGTEIFDPVPSLTLGGPGWTDGAVDVAVADMDGDGDLDLVSANASGNTLTIFLQSGAGVFDPVPSLTLDNPLDAEAPQSVTAADLDGDGDLDLMSSNPGSGGPSDENSNTLTVFFQTGAGVFETESLALSGAPTVFTDLAVDVMAADMDGDGDVDIVSANGASGNLTVFYNAHKP